MDQLLTAQQVARFLNIRASTVYALCRRGQLPHVRVTEGVRRALIRFRAEDIERLIEERTSSPTQESEVTSDDNDDKS